MPFPAVYHEGTNHVHLLFQVGRGDTLSKAIDWLSSTLVRRSNRRMERKCGLAGPGARVAWQELGSGLVSIRPKHGGSSEPD